MRKYLGYLLLLPILAGAVIFAFNRPKVEQIELSEPIMGGTESAVEFNSTPLITDSGLKAYYRLEADGTDSKNGYSLTLVNTPAFGAAKFNNGMDLGTAGNKYGTYTTDNMGITGGNITIMGWMKFNTTPGNDIDYTLAAQRDGSTSEVQYSLIVGTNHTGSPHMWFYRNTNNANDQLVEHTVTTTWDTSTWHHFAGTYDGTNLKIYFDGTYISSQAASGTGADTGFPSGISVGAMANPSYYYIAKSVIDDVVVLNRALTDDEISKVANGGWPSTESIEYNIPELLD